MPFPYTFPFILPTGFPSQDATFAQIVNLGMQKAGRSDLGVQIGSYLSLWLRSVYSSWPWPFLVRRKTGISVPAGTTSLTIGKGSNGITQEIQKIIDPLFLYDSTYSTKARPRIRQIWGDDLRLDDTIRNPSTDIGLPHTWKVRSRSDFWGKWDMIPIPVPDKDYLLAIDYIEMPVYPTADEDIPLYPNVRTMVQAAYVETLKWTKGADDPAYQQSLDELNAAITEDKIRFGQVPGTNDLVILDPGTFK